MTIHFDHISICWGRKLAKNTKSESWESGEPDFEDARSWGFVYLEIWRFRIRVLESGAWQRDKKVDFWLTYLVILPGSKTFKNRFSMLRNGDLCNFRISNSLDYFFRFDFRKSCFFCVVFVCLVFFMCFGISKFIVICNLRLQSSSSIVRSRRDLSIGRRIIDNEPI